MSTVYRDKCRHFTGIQHKTCKAGVAYEDVRDKNGPALGVMPCIDVGKGCPDTCPQRSLLTQEEHAARESALKERAKEIVALLAAGKCHVCQGDIEPSRIVGHCKYGACGHRIGQVSRG
jgi:hypothetical protein